MPTTWSIDSAVPSASGPYPLTWQDQYPVSPLVRLTDSSSMALLQNWVVIFAVAFGITGSVLASLLFEWLRRPSRDGTAGGSSPPPLHSRFLAASRHIQKRPRAGAGRWLALAAPSSSSGTRGAAAPGPGTADSPGGRDAGRLRGRRKAVP